jgi:hypothetical protein
MVWLAYVFLHWSFPLRNITLTHVKLGSLSSRVNPVANGDHTWSLINTYFERKDLIFLTTFPIR